jgi:two-component system, chemotaxis family, chemotaxis protein CheY
MNAKLRKILVVDDSDLIHRLYDLILMRWKNEGLQVIHASNGRDGLDKLRLHPDADVVLLDIHMPIMGGLEFLEHVGSDKALRAVPVIIVSTKGKEEDTARGMEAGARAYMTKPFSPKELLAALDAVVSGATCPGQACGSSSSRDFSSRQELAYAVPVGTR